MIIECRGPLAKWRCSLENCAASHSSVARPRASRVHFVARGPRRLPRRSRPRSRGSCASRGSPRTLSSDRALDRIVFADEGGIW